MDDETALEGEEWLAAFRAYRAAQARMSTVGAYLTLNEWQTTVRAVSAGGATVDWLDYVTRVVRALRRRQRLFAQSYHQYARALDAGVSSGPTVNGDEARMLSDYRDTFLEGVQDAALMGETDDSSWPADNDWEFIQSELRQVEPEGRDENRRSMPLTDVDLDRHIQEFLDTWSADRALEAEEFQWPEDEGESNDEAHRKYFEELLKEAEKNVQEAFRKRDTIEEIQEESEGPKETPGERRDRIRQEQVDAHFTEGNKLAGQVMAATSDAADQVAKWVRDTDRRVMGVARGTGPNPCAFCAVLASRGFIYRSVSSAMTTAGASGAFARYHPNCQCYPIIRWVKGPLRTPEAQDYLDLWENSKGGKGGQFNTFRRALYSRNKDQINEKRRRRYWEKKAEAGLQ